MAEETSANEPVKVKMTLRRAQPSIQGAAEVRPATAAAVEAVEARWRAEEVRQCAELRRKFVSSCLGWHMFLLMFIGLVWFLFGSKYLPPEYTYSTVRQKVVAFCQSHRNTLGF